MQPGTPQERQPLTNTESILEKQNRFSFATGSRFFALVRKPEHFANLNSKLSPIRKNTLKTITTAMALFALTMISLPVGSVANELIDNPVKTEFAGDIEPIQKFVRVSAVGDVKAVQVSVLTPNDAAPFATADLTTQPKTDSPELTKTEVNYTITSDGMVFDLDFGDKVPEKSLQDLANKTLQVNGLLRLNKTTPLNGRSVIVVESFMEILPQTEAR